MSRATAVTIIVSVAIICMTVSDVFKARSYILELSMQCKRLSYISCQGSRMATKHISKNATSTILLSRGVKAARSRNVDGEANKYAIDIEADRQLVLGFTNAMVKRLYAKRRVGRGEWWAEKISIVYLRDLLDISVLKGDMVDVANLAAMIHARECFEAREKYVKGITE